MQALTWKNLKEALAHGSMLRIQQHLEPTGSGGLVYPPTYGGGGHIFREAWIEDERRQIVVLDSPQSQSNRIEEALLAAHRRGDIRYPDIEITVPSPMGQEHYSILQLSHRVYDAALLLTEQDGIPFKRTDVGKAIYGARLERATGLHVHAPVTLVLGGWDSHSGGGPLSAKIPRVVTSEIVGVDAIPAQRGAVKFDPMDIRKGAGPVYESQDPERVFELDKKHAKEKKDKNPSDVGLGNVPSTEERGASIRYALQSSLVSLAAVRRLRFEDDQGQLDLQRDRAGQVSTVALGLYGLLAQMEAGYFLRSGCDLIPTSTPTLEVVGRTLEEVEHFAIGPNDARALLERSLEEAEEVGLAWRRETMSVTADDRLQVLVRRSRETAQAEEE
ncbi:type I-G CRISPR-associated RAMP protein Csb1/Cas7g [Arhodomonas sp. AD133]|uniref:type I-G CRISPR-associated RAMP protein Csb1/Cas7g n=1 Tax=Arhodomonas sp. AD133 TaxID=3415009 RepID=UPI003EBC8F9F